MVPHFLKSSEMRAMSGGLAIVSFDEFSAKTKPRVVSIL